MSKRENYLSWEEYFMGIAKLSAQRSKDPNTQVGACLVSKDNKILGIGYNGMPRGCSDDIFPWSKPEKYLYVCHAEINCIINVNEFSLLNGSTMYTTLFPCNECAKIIIQTKISKIVYDDDKYSDMETTKASRRMLEHLGIDIIKYNDSNKKK